MIFRGIDNDGDWLFGNGKSSYFKDDTAINVNIRTRLLSFVNDCFFDLDAGVDWWNLLGGKDQAAILLQTRAVISESYGVTRITGLSADYNRTTRKFSLQYTIDTVYSQDFNGTATLSPI